MKTDEHYTRNRRPGILCVDDEEPNLAILEAELEDEDEDEGYIIHTAMSGEEALKIFDLAMHLGEPQIDLVILDICMPGMDGIEVLRQMKERCPRLPVILHTAYPEYIMGRMELASWAPDDYIVKSYNFDKLKASVRRHLTK